MENKKRLIEIPEDGIIRIPIMAGETAVGEKCIDLSHIPTVDAVEVVHAAWTDKGFCTNCGHRAHIVCVGFNCTGGTRVEYERTPYCAGCGAKMDRKDF